MEILTANELISGAVVYLDATGKWQPDINSARIFRNEEEAARNSAVTAAKATGRLISIEVEMVALVGGRVIANRLRERIRADGPTAPYGPKRQTLGEDGHVSL